MDERKLAHVVDSAGSMGARELGWGWWAWVAAGQRRSAAGTLLEEGPCTDRALHGNPNEQAIQTMRDEHIRGI